MRISHPKTLFVQRVRNNRPNSGIVNGYNYVQPIFGYTSHRMQIEQARYIVELEKHLGFILSAGHHVNGDFVV